MIPCNLLSSSFSLPCRADTLLVNSDVCPNLAPTSFCSQFSAPITSRCFLCLCRRNSSLDPNAESVSGGRFRFRDEAGDGEVGGDFGQGSRRRWWSDNNSEDGLEEEFEPIDVEDEDGEQLWDKIWIFKVFKSYGYLLPALIASMLLATGPKAFLMALALPLGQSLISLAINKLWDPLQGEPSASPRVRRRPFSRSSAKFRKQEQDETSDEYKREVYQSWVAADADLNNGKAAGSKRPLSFGGWDELDRERAEVRRPPPRSDRSSQSSQVKVGKLSKKSRYVDAPLFIRLLVAVFPFLGSWIRIL